MADTVLLDLGDKAESSRYICEFGKLFNPVNPANSQLAKKYHPAFFTHVAKHAMKTDDIEGLFRQLDLESLAPDMAFAQESSTTSLAEAVRNSVYTPETAFKMQTDAIAKAVVQTLLRMPESEANEDFAAPGSLRALFKWAENSKHHQSLATVLCLRHLRTLFDNHGTIALLPEMKSLAESVEYFVCPAEGPPRLWFNNIYKSLGAPRKCL